MVAHAPERARRLGPLKVLAFSSNWEGHLRRVLSVVQRLAAGGATVHVCSELRAPESIVAGGALVHDWFERYPVALADSASLPFSCRQVTYAGQFGDRAAAEMRPLAPDLVLYDTFSVIGRVVAHVLDVPGVNVCAGHNVDPAKALEQLLAIAPVRISDACWRAAGRLRDEFGWANASPYSFAHGASRWLNVYCEPSQFLAEADRAAFEPVAYFGSLPDEVLSTPAASRRDDPQTLHVYASFGTAIWSLLRLNYRVRDPLAALRAIAEAVARRPAARLTISLGGATLPDSDVGPLRRGNVTVERRVDQWLLLGEADLFVTHHGLNSTHEAIWHGVPMLSFPFNWDQPDLAARCQALGLALPLGAGANTVLEPDVVDRAIDQMLDQAAAVRARLAQAREWERDVMAGRDGVAHRIAALA
jgi:UDP:flavonoid glycosyltransferase YjiC (YdhE family)